MFATSSWQSLRQVCDIELFGIWDPTIAKHLKNIFESGELQGKVVVSILEHTTQQGFISRKQAEEKAFTEYDKLNKTQRIESDFDKLVKRLPPAAN